MAGGVLSMLAYGIVVWAMSQAPVAVVAALMSVFVLKERPGSVRLAAIVLLAAAVALLRLS